MKKAIKRVKLNVPMKRVGYLGVIIIALATILSCSNNVPLDIFVGTKDVRSFAVNGRIVARNPSDNSVFTVYVPRSATFELRYDDKVVKVRAKFDGRECYASIKGPPDFFSLTEEGKIIEKTVTSIGSEQ